MDDTNLPGQFASLPKYAKEAIDPLTHLTTIVENFMLAARRGGLGIEEFSNSLENFIRYTGEAKNAVMTMIMDFTQGTIVADKFLQVISVGDQIFGRFGEAVLAAVDGVEFAAKAIDAMTIYNRDLDKSMFELASSFGLGLDAAIEYGDYITSSSSRLASADMGFIKVSELEEALKSMANAGIPMERMSDEIVSTAGSFDLLTTAILQSKSLGMSVSEYMGNMSKMINRQGLSTQQAAEQMSMFGEVSRNTGLKINDVVNTLQSVADSFSKMGMSVNFGKGIMEGFANSLKSVGLGFEHALELSGELSRSIGALTSNYSMAYLTFQRGGLDINSSGTALGASIGMRAELLDAEKRGDQGAMGLQIAGAIRDTISSMTGGEILTVTEARDNPALESLYFTQTKMLESMYGISDAASQDRVLELLKQLNTATEAGDTNLAESLGQDLEEAIDTRNKTLGVQEKIEAHLSNAVAELNTMNRNLVASLGQGGETEIVGLVANTISGAQSVGAAASRLAGFNTGEEEEGVSETVAGGGMEGGEEPESSAEAAQPANREQQVPGYVQTLLERLSVLINQNHILLNNRN